MNLYCSMGFTMILHFISMVSAHGARDVVQDNESSGGHNITASSVGVVTKDQSLLQLTHALKIIPSRTGESSADLPSAAADTLQSGSKQGESCSLNGNCGGARPSSHVEISRDHSLLQSSRVANVVRAGHRHNESNADLFKKSDCGAVQRRRRDADMCSCRRRFGAMYLETGYSCQQNTIAPCGDNCPINWEVTSETKAESEWCEVPIPQSTWNIKSCPTASPSLPVKVLTYNLFWWYLFGQNNGVSNGTERSAGKLIKDSALPEYDVMGFQECDVPWRILGDAIAEGLPSDYVPISGGRALAIAYHEKKWSLLDSGVEDVGEDSPDQYYGKRAAQWVRLQQLGGSKTLLFVNHHGPLPVSAGGGCTGSATAFNILGLIAGHARPGDAVILVGDFNARDDPDGRIDKLAAHINLIFSGTSHQCTGPDCRSTVGVDHIFTNCATDVVNTTNLGLGGSDHDALSAVIKI